MEYWRVDQQKCLSEVICRASAEERLAVSAGRLRILISGGSAGEHFQEILVANIQHWGYEAVVLPLSHGYDVSPWEEMEGDVLLYDMDVSVLKDTDLHSAPRSGSLRIFAEREYPQARLLIALSSRSLSRLVLEQMGAIALLRKPFDMRHLERYLRIFQKLFSAGASSSERAIPGLHTLSRKVSHLLVGEEDIKEDIEKGAITLAVQRKRILVADDRAEVTAAIHQCLMEQTDWHTPYEVREVHDGLDLLEQCLDWQPHCVVTDLLMPWLTGYQVMRCLAAFPSLPKPAFVVISALTQHEIPENRSYLQDRAVLYIDKPFDVENLLAQVEQALA